MCLAERPIVYQCVLTGSSCRLEIVPVFDAETLNGESLAEYIGPPENRDESAELVGELGDGHIVEGEVQRETAKGFRTFAFTGVPVDMDDSEVDAYAIYSDVTTEQEQRQRLQVLYRVLRHDLRNRMNCRKGQCGDHL